MKKHQQNIKQWHNKKIHFIFIVLFFLLILGIATADMFTSDRYFSENENRILESKPKMDLKGLFKGTFSNRYETYVTDQFIARDLWIQLKNYTEIILQKKELNGVYLVKNGTLIEKHSDADINYKQALEKQLKLVKKSQEYANTLGTEHVKIMLVPTASMILTDKLPKYTDEFQQLHYLDSIRNSLEDPKMLLPVGETLLEHNQEYIYYKTDHHWTTLGAYYGYLVWANSLGMSPIMEFGVETISDNFFGTLHSKINIEVPKDTIDRMYPLGEEEQQFQVNYIYEEKSTNSLYDMEKLYTKDQYSVFLGGNFPLIQISATQLEKDKNGKKLLIVKDSYANSFAPFAANHFENVYMLDPRFYRDDIQDVIQKYEITDLLILYDVIHFIENY